MTSILRSYNKFVLRNPLIAMSLTTGTTMGLGNIISQTAIEKRSLNSIDWPRVIRFAAFGYLISGPLLRYWFYAIDKYFTGARFKPLKMMAVDQTLFSPFINGVMLTYLPLVSGKSLEETKKRLFETFPVVMKGNYMVWPAIQVVNFYLIPLQHRVLFVNICIVIWSTFLAYVTK